MLNAIMSIVGGACPAPHSPGIAPEAVFVLAAVMASFNVQEPSFATESDVVLTVIVAAEAGPPGKARIDAARAVARRRPERFSGLVFRRDRASGT
jgi:hypothetical protein